MNIMNRSALVAAFSGFEQHKLVAAVEQYRRLSERFPLCASYSHTDPIQLYGESSSSVLEYDPKDRRWHVAFKVSKFVQSFFPHEDIQPEEVEASIFQTLLKSSSRDEFIEQGNHENEEEIFGLFSDLLQTPFNSNAKKIELVVLKIEELEQRLFRLDRLSDDLIPKSKEAIRQISERLGLPISGEGRIALIWMCDALYNLLKGIQQDVSISRLDVSGYFIYGRQYQEYFDNHELLDEIFTLLEPYPHILNELYELRQDLKILQ